MTDNLLIQKLGKNILREKKIVSELISLFNYSKNIDDPEEKRMISLQITMLKKSLQKTGQEMINSAEKISLFKPLYPGQKTRPPIPAKPASISAVPAKPLISQQAIIRKKDKKFKPDSLEKLTLKRIKKKEKKIVKKKERKPSKYIKISSKFFYNTSMSFINKGMFRKLKRDLIKSNIEFVPATYISVILFTTIMSVIASLFITLFFLFFNLSALPPFITSIEESIGIRFLKIFWILFAIPAATFLFVYFYPSLEKKSLETKINRELPFAAIHMSSISGSMIEPSKIFNIIISTKEYPNLEKEFIKLQNEINIYGYDLVTALRNRSFNSPSRKLADLFNGLATTITSGGNLPEFFKERSQTLLFEHRLEMEKQLKTAETLMDIYISVVIAAPMVLMLVLMMMRISGLGIALSPSMISLVMILAVTLVNIFFLTFLHIKQPKT
jgi:flagellar protein FlaJ